MVFWKCMLWKWPALVLHQRTKHLQEFMALIPILHFNPLTIYWRFVSLKHTFKNIHIILIWYSCWWAKTCLLFLHCVIVFHKMCISHCLSSISLLLLCTFDEVRYDDVAKHLVNLFDVVGECMRLLRWGIKKEIKATSITPFLPFFPSHSILSLFQLYLYHNE